MKTNLFKRIGIVILVCMLMITASSTVFAAENVTENDTIFETEEQVSRSSAATIPAHGTATIDVISVKGSKIGKLTIITASHAPDTQNITWVLKNGNTEVIKGKTGVNSMYESFDEITLITGDYKLVVTNNAEQQTAVHVFFK